MGRYASRFPIDYRKQNRAQTYTAEGGHATKTTTLPPLRLVAGSHPRRKRWLVTTNLVRREIKLHFSFRGVGAIGSVN